MKFVIFAALFLSSSTLQAQELDLFRRNPNPGFTLRNGEDVATATNEDETRYLRSYKFNHWQSIDEGRFSEDQTKLSSMREEAEAKADERISAMNEKRDPKKLATLKKVALSESLPFKKVTIAINGYVTNGDLPNIEGMLTGSDFDKLLGCKAYAEGGRAWVECLSPNFMAYINEPMESKKQTTVKTTGARITSTTLDACGAKVLGAKYGKARPGKSTIQKQGDQENTLYLGYSNFPATLNVPGLREQPKPVVAVTEVKPIPAPVTQKQPVEQTPAIKPKPAPVEQTPVIKPIPVPVEQTQPKPAPEVTPVTSPSPPPKPDPIITRGEEAKKELPTVEKELQQKIAEQKTNDEVKKDFDALTTMSNNVTELRNTLETENSKLMFPLNLDDIISNKPMSILFALDNSESISYQCPNYNSYIDYGKAQLDALLNLLPDGSTITLAVTSVHEKKTWGSYSYVAAGQPIVLTPETRARLKATMELVGVSELYNRKDVHTDVPPYKFEKVMNDTDDSESAGAVIEWALQNDPNLKAIYFLSDGVHSRDELSATPPSIPLILKPMGKSAYRPDKLFEAGKDNVSVLDDATEVVNDQFIARYKELVIQYNDLKKQEDELRKKAEAHKIKPLPKDQAEQLNQQIKELNLKQQKLKEEIEKANAAKLKAPAK